MISPATIKYVWLVKKCILFVIMYISHIDCVKKKLIFFGSVIFFVIILSFKSPLGYIKSN